MMKVYFFIIFTIISFLCIGQNKNGIAYYSKESKISNNQLISSTKVNEEIKKAVSNIDENIRNNEYILEFNTYFGKYQLVKKLDSDESSSFKNKLALAFSGFNGVAFFDKKNGTIVVEKNVLDETLLITTKFEDIDWVLTKKKLILNGLTCYKAKRILKKEGRNGSFETEIIAWYAPEINLPYGPDGFGGLPGIIIQLENGNVVTTLKKIEFIDEEMIINLPTKGKKLSENEYNAFMKDFSMNREKYLKKD